MKKIPKILFKIKGEIELIEKFTNLPNFFHEEIIGNFRYWLKELLFKRINQMKKFIKSFFPNFFQDIFLNLKILVKFFEN